MPTWFLTAIVWLCYVVATVGSEPSLSTSVTSAPAYPTNNPKPAADASVPAFALESSAIAPPGAAGSATLDGRTLLVHLRNLGPGRYDLQAELRSNTFRRSLGIITIVDPTLSPDRQANDNKKEASAHPESVLIETDVRLTLPDGLQPADVANILLLNSGGNVVLESRRKQ